MPYEIDYDAAVALANSNAATELAAAAAELAGDTLSPDPLATLQGLATERAARRTSDASEAQIRALQVAALAKFTGAASETDSTPNYTRSPALSLPVANGDTLETAIAKLLALLNRHPLAPGIIVPIYQNYTASQIHNLDLIDTAQASGTISNSPPDGPFWLLCNGTPQNGQAVPDLRGRTLLGTDVLNVGGCGVNVDDTTVTCTSTTGLVAGMPVSGTGVPAGAIIEKVTDATHFELSLAATSTVSSQTYAAGGSFGTNTVSSSKLLNINQLPEHYHGLSNDVSAGPIVTALEAISTAPDSNLFHDGTGGTLTGSGVVKYLSSISYGATGVRNPNGGRSAVTGGVGQTVTLPAPPNLRIFWMLRSSRTLFS